MPFLSSRCRYVRITQKGGCLSISFVLGGVSKSESSIRPFVSLLGCFSCPTSLHLISFNNKHTKRKSSSSAKNKNYHPRLVVEQPSEQVVVDAAAAAAADATNNKQRKWHRISLFNLDYFGILPELQFLLGFVMVNEVG